MMDLFGRRVVVVQSADPSTVGIGGVVSLESMRMITITTGATNRRIPKVGTVLQLQDTGKLVAAGETLGRIEDRLARGSKL